MACKGGLGGHLCTRPGKRVLVHFRDGRKFEDIFVDRPRKATHVIFKELGRVHVSLLRCVSILKRASGAQGVSNGR